MGWENLARGLQMVRLTRLSGKPFVLNADRILFVEEAPDTTITLENKERVLVKDSANDVIRKVIDYQRTIRSFPTMTPQA